MSRPYSPNVGEGLFSEVLFGGSRQIVVSVALPISRGDLAIIYRKGAARCSSAAARFPSEGVRPPR